MLELPEGIRKYLPDETYETDHTGMSDSSVLLFQDKVLKIQKNTAEAENEYRMLQWLSDRLPVPGIYAHEVQDGMSFLLMEKCSGKMACDEKYMLNPALQVETLARGMHLLWATDISDCPCSQRLKYKLEQARFNVEHNLVDTENSQPDTYGKNGFQDPTALLNWLYENQPEEELALSHGDFCLPNVIIDDDSSRKKNVIQYIDLGRSGIADKWCDIALCYRSLTNNYNGSYGTGARPGFDGQLLFQKLGVAPDWDKIRYYILLDELF